MKNKNIIGALIIAVGTYILGRIVIDIIASGYEAADIMKAIYYLASVVSFWGYLLYKKKE